MISDLNTALVIKLCVSFPFFPSMRKHNMRCVLWSDVSERQPTGKPYCRLTCSALQILPSTTPTSYFLRWAMVISMSWSCFIVFPNIPVLCSSVSTRLKLSLLTILGLKVSGFSKNFSNLLFASYDRPAFWIVSVKENVSDLLKLLSQGNFFAD